METCHFRASSSLFCFFSLWRRSKARISAWMFSLRLSYNCTSFTSQVKQMELKKPNEADCKTICTGLLFALFSFRIAATIIMTPFKTVSKATNNPYFQIQREMEVICCWCETACVNTPANTPQMFDAAPALKKKRLSLKVRSMFWVQNTMISDQDILSMTAIIFLFLPI